MILFILLHERNHQAHVASTNSWKVEETWTQENHWTRTRHNEEIQNDTRWIESWLYDLFCLYFINRNFFFNRKNQDQKRLESAYWEKKEDNGHDKRDMRFFLLWEKKSPKSWRWRRKILRHSSSFWNRKSCHARDAMRDARRCDWCLLTLTQN